MCLLFGIEAERIIPNNMHYLDCDEGAFRIMPVPPDETAYLVVIQPDIFRVFAHLFRYTTWLQWPGPSLREACQMEQTPRNTPSRSGR
jgi:hypothetical protein